MQLASQDAQHEAAHAHANGAPMQARFYPYDYNGGCVAQESCMIPGQPLTPVPARRRLLRRTVLAVAGKDFSIVAGDTRMSTGFSIKTRHASKIFKM